MTADIVALQRQLDDLNMRMRLLELGERPNQATDTQANVTFAEILTSLTGSFTPTYVGTTIAGTFTYTTQLGYYVKLGGLVFITGRVVISAISVAPTGNMTIGGLPFTCNAAGYRYAFSFSQINQFNYTNTAFQLVGRVNASNTVIVLEESFDNAAGVAVPAANFTNAACDLGFSGFYQY